MADVMASAHHSRKTIQEGSFAENQNTVTHVTRGKGGDWPRVALF